MNMGQGKGPQNPWLMLGCAWLLGFAMWAPVLCIPPIEHLVKEELHLSHAQMGALFSLPVAILAVAAIPMGFLADRIGIRKAAGIGAIIMTAGSIMRGVADSFAALIVFTCLFGVGFALIYTSLPKIVGTWFPQEKVGLATGIYVTGWNVGASIALAITLPLVYPVTNTFQGVIYIWSIPPMVATILWWLMVKESYTGPVQSRQPVTGHKPSAAVWKNKYVWLIGVMLFCNNVIYYTWAGWTPALLMLKGASPELAALITSVRSWAGIPFVFLVPWVSYKLGLRKPVLWVCTITTALATFSAIYIPVPLFWPLMVVLALQGGAFSIIFALPIELVPKQSVGTASGIVLSTGYIGALVGPWVAGRILDTAGTLTPALIMLVAVAVAWTCLAFIIPETGPRAKGRVR